MCEILYRNEEAYRKSEKREGRSEVCFRMKVIVVKV